MDAPQFDRLARSLTNAASRRGLLSSLAATAIGLAATRFSGGVEAKKQRKNKQPKKLKRNAFGCVDVGGKCRGNSANCCSGICQGKKPKQGKKDTSTCVAHNVEECQADDDICSGTLATCGSSGLCTRTTGKAGFCADPAAVDCSDCQKDKDCETDFGPGAACIVCIGQCEATGGTFCLSAAN